MSAARVVPEIVMHERSPLRRLGSVRRAPRSARASLDTDKQLATSAHFSGQLENQSAAQWLKQQLTPRDERVLQYASQRKLMRTLETIWRTENPERQRDWERLHNCQMEWIGFKPTCCDGSNVAVPIGCNHRLCVLCNGFRSGRYRERVSALFDSMATPWFLTLTLPNFLTIDKARYAGFRAAMKKLLKKHDAWIKGGVYSIETTFNREQRTWHVHAHLLCDVAFAPQNRDAFIRLKRAIEFDWLKLTSREAARGWTFETWFEATQNRVPGLPRRIVDIRAVKDRSRAAREVLKYITKVTAFSDDPAAVEEFLCAVKHTRMIQTFGSWYGYKFPEDVNDPTTWTKLACPCGANLWEKIGVFQRHEVEMHESGRWYVKDEYNFGARAAPHGGGDPLRHTFAKLKAEVSLRARQSLPAKSA